MGREKRGYATGSDEYMRQQYHDVQHTLNWYCLDTGVSNWVWISVR